MNRNDKIRLWVVLIVIAAALFYIWPLEGRLNLGLDLKGGAHIVLQAKGTPESPLRDDSIDRLLAVLRNRIDQYGVAEPIIQKSGTDRIIVDLPGIQDPAAALELIGRTAQMDFREVIDQTGANLPAEPVRSNYDSDIQFVNAQERWKEALAQISNASADLLARSKNTAGSVVAPAEEAGRYYLLGPVVLSGKDLINAEVAPDSLGRMGVSLEFNSEGARLFEEATARLIGRQLAIVLDNVVISAPVVQDRIAGGRAQITGRFTADEAGRLAIMLKAGALPVAVEIAENRSVGPSLGADSVKQGLEAGLFGAGMVLVFMLLYYQFRGLAADVALIVTIILIFAGLMAFNATLTLPGIAGIVLTLGMAVDGNVLIYERIREERNSGKTPMAALDAGFRKALVTILDSNITTLIAALVLFYFGSGSVRGFGVTLSIGLVASVFANVVVTRALLQLFIKRGGEVVKR
ncbi:MAG: protein translocase subunit SecD [Synergistaceae bacterium]|nr:protein translocase subunit SecD [Synergistaceae bacterium]MBQ3449775.1 protein translocase subunit SecD [Synergistaceae bacterium]MBQ3693631.1 protein translocase subunit SecD [Synergistaceae bacterium]MBQ9628686.1 protein translocase subunit SecD [Synergistaceae bacterium]MBR0250562.1 protein translocase subunit SecD [Synergistaceae bacterium]